jgi:uncharacterized RDD family membrane protein YckC
VEYGERLTITTPEGVAVELLLANIGSRFLATMLDLVIQAAIALVGALIAVALFDGGVLSLVLFVGGFLLIFGFDVAFEVANHGRTPGKKAAGLRVVRETGAPVTFVTSAIRNAMRLIDILPGVYGIAMISIFATRNNQRLGDLAAGTVVIRERTPTLPRESIPEAPRVYGWDTSAITTEDLAIVRSFLDRRATLNPGARAQLASDLSTRLRAKVAGAPDLEPEPFLETLVATRD